MPRWIAGVWAGLVVSVIAGCGSPTPTPTPSQSVEQPPSDRDQLAGLAAAAKDRRYVATYTLSTTNRNDRTVTVAFGTDGTWVVGIPGGAWSGLADIAVYGSAAGVFQCLLSAPGAARSRPDLGPFTPRCAAMSTYTFDTDPLVQHIFTDWIDPLVDRATALSVAATASLPNAQGACYSVESNSTALAPPLDPGIYCYAADGLLAAAQVGFGTLTLAAPAAAAPPSVTMPAPLAGREPLSVRVPAAPPPPSASTSA